MACFCVSLFASSWLSGILRRLSVLLQGFSYSLGSAFHLKLGSPVRHRQPMCVGGVEICYKTRKILSKL